MRRPTFLIMLALLFAKATFAQQISPPWKFNADPIHSDILLNLVQQKILKIKQDNLQRQAANASAIPIHPVKSLSNPLSNGCGVKASFTPANDTTLYVGQAITFTNTSQNADSYEWFENVYFKYTSVDLTNYVPSVGITQIMLVAHQGNCTDTAVTYIVRNGTAPADSKSMNTSYGRPNINTWVSGMVADKTDGYLLSGVTGLYAQNWWNAPYLVRVTETGCIKWSKLLPVQKGCSVRAMLATYDGGFVMQVCLPDDLDHCYLLKVDANGNILWARSYTGNNSLSIVNSIKELSDHSLMVLSFPWSGQALVMTSLTETGGFLWQKQYLFNSNDYSQFSDLVEKNGSAYVSASYYQLVDALTNKWNEFPMLFKVDVATGNLQWCKGYTSPNKYYFSSGIHFYKDGLILNGFADSLINAPNNKWSNYQSLLETDLDGNIRQAKLLMNSTELDIPIANNLIVDENGNLELMYSGTEFLDLQPLYSQQSFYLRLDANKNILWQQNYAGYLVPQLVQAVAAPQKGMAMIGEKFSPLLNPIYGLAENLVLVKVDSNGTAAGQFCDESTAFISVQDMAVNPYSIGTPVVTDYSLQVTDEPISASNANTELRYHCEDYVPHCSFMKLSGKSFVCNLKDTLEFIAHKDPYCGDPVVWTYDNANIKTAYQDGGKARLLFKTPGMYTIVAEKPFPCTNIRDSIIVTVASSLINFNLGKDTTLCAGDSLVLRPLGKYDQYLWQDGSVLDSFKIKTDGAYHVMVTDSCGNTKADTIQVNFQTSIPLNLGAALTKCAGDTILFHPPDGFKDYTWTPFYHMIMGDQNTIELFPEKDTSYQLLVHGAGGCSGSAQLQILIYPGSQVQLGNDTAICFGAHAVFAAKGNFVSYAWSNGGSTNAIDVQTAGKYFVLATDQNKCRSSDTVALLVYPLPLVNLDGGMVLCKGESFLLDAGAGFVSYLWQDGSTKQQFNVSDTGYYRVQVTDQHQCAAADSFHLEQYAVSPQNFLPADTVVCTYTGDLLQPKGNFMQYNWSTGETSPTIQVKAAGLYTLQVVSQQGCTGKDSIRIDMKDCEALLVFPNAFTPNHDGNNDIFRLRYPGHVVNYQLQIFNRWGQRIFSTSDSFAGWDGTFNSEPQPVGNYIWIVRYTDQNGKNQTLEGNLLLIR